MRRRDQPRKNKKLTADRKERLTMMKSAVLAITGWGPLAINLNEAGVP